LIQTRDGREWGYNEGEPEVATSRFASHDLSLRSLKTGDLQHRSDLGLFAIQAGRKIAARHGIENLETIESACHTGLPENHVNVVLL
jgi:hypothetical protein